MSTDSSPTTQDNSSPDNHNWKAAKWGAVAVVDAAAITGVATYLTANPPHVWPPSPPSEYLTLRVEVPQKNNCTLRNGRTPASTRQWLILTV